MLFAEPCRILPVQRSGLGDLEPLVSAKRHATRRSGGLYGKCRSPEAATKCSEIRTEAGAQKWLTRRECAASRSSPATSCSAEGRESDGALIKED
jgi:hypothetical protein